MFLSGRDHDLGFGVLLPFHGCCPCGRCLEMLRG